MTKLLDIFFMLQGFNVCYNGEVYTTTLWARFICNVAVKEKRFKKINKNYYKHVR